MRKTIQFIVVLSISITISATAQKFEWEKINNELPKQTEIELLKSEESYCTIKIRINSLGLKVVLTPKGEANVVDIPEGSRIEKLGAPDLPKLTQSIVIPNYDEMKVEVISSNFNEVKNIEIAPSKGIMSRDKSPSDYPYVYGEEYSKNEFFPSVLAKLREPHIIRSIRGQTIIINPIQYNPITKRMRIFTEIIIKVSSTGKKGINTLGEKTTIKESSPIFNKIFSHHFLNYESTQYTPLNDKGAKRLMKDKILIICDNEFLSSMQSFVCLKDLSGLSTEIIDYSTIGSSSALKTYIANYYANNRLTFLLLVGDHSNIPTSTTSAGYSDNNYGYIVGDDHYLDIFVGRFSAENIEQVETMVDRTVFYEKELNSSATWFSNGVGIASNECCGDDGESDEEHVDNIKEDLEGYGYTINDCYQDGGSAAQLTSLLNTGAGIINYTGHGEINRWASMVYYNSNVNSLQNVNRLPFIFSVCCQVGNFINYTCFAETWLRATNNGQPTGAIAFCGSTRNQSWSSPMSAQDEMNDVLVFNDMRTYGEVFVTGLFKMIDEYGTDGEDMADTWVCFGDPSLKLRTPGHPEPFNMTISGPSIVCTSNSTFILDNKPLGTTVNWEKSNNLSYVSGQGSTLYTVKAASSSTYGWGWVEVTINGDCDDVTIREDFWVGKFESTVVTGQAAVCPDTYYTYTAQVPGGHSSSYSYTWTYPSNWMWPYQYQNTIRLKTPMYNPQYGTVRVRITNACGTSGYSGITVYPGYNCGGYYMASPNPSSSYVDIDIDPKMSTSMEEIYNNDISIRVYDNMGTVVFNSNVESLPYRIDTSVLPNGEYVVKIITRKKDGAEKDQRFESLKIIVNH